MAKRQKLTYNNAELTQSLKQSTGQGVDALFSQPDDGAVPNRVERTRQHSSPPQEPTRQAHNKAVRTARRMPRKPAPHRGAVYQTPKDDHGKKGRIALIHQMISNERKNEAPLGRNNERSLERTKIRHTFDIFKDQLASLHRIQFSREEVFGKRDLLGALVQEALDMFITKERNNE